MSTAQSEARPARLAVLDAQRGLIMIFMALDHVSLFLAGQHFSEFWGIPLPDYGNAVSLVTRVISHLCAPGFFFLMGVGMHLFWASRHARGMAEPQIIKHFAVRGFLLIVVDIFIVTPTWIIGSLEQFMDGESPLGAVPGAGGDILMATGVLAALGGAMILAAFFLRLGAITTAVLGVLTLLVCQAIVPDASLVFEPVTLLEHLFLIPGHDSFLVITYPILPWFSVCLLGVAYGHAVRANPDRAMQLALRVGVIALVAFVVIRGAGGFGVHHPVTGNDWMAYLTVTKYPPSIAFLLLSLGTNAVLFALLHRAQQQLAGAGRPLLVFGRAPLFFYVVHLYLYSLVGLAYPGHTSLAAMYPVWILGLVALYPLCKRYDTFKREKSEDSLWRLF